MICYLSGFFFPAVRPCWGHSPGQQYVVREYDQRWCRGHPFPWQPVVCVLQDPSSLPVYIHIPLQGWFSLGALSCPKCPTWEKREALFKLYCLSSARWRHWSFCEKPWLLRVPGNGRNSHHGPEQLGSCWKERKGTEHICLGGRAEFAHTTTLVFCLEDPSGSGDMLLFYFCFDNWSQGQPGFVWFVFGFFFNWRNPNKTQ